MRYPPVMFGFEYSRHDYAVVLPHGGLLFQVVYFHDPAHPPPGVFTDLDDDELALNDLVNRLFRKLLSHYRDRYSWKTETLKVHFRRYHRLDRGENGLYPDLSMLEFRLVNGSRRAVIYKITRDFRSADAIERSIYFVVTATSHSALDSLLVEIMLTI